MQNLAHALITWKSSTLSKLANPHIPTKLQQIKNNPRKARCSGLIVNDEEELVFAAVTGSNQIAVIDMMTDAVVQTVTVGTGPTAITGDDDGEILFVANQAGGTISVLRPNEMGRK